MTVKEVQNTLQNSRIQRNGLPQGTVAPQFSLPGLYGGVFTLDTWKNNLVLLVFSDPNCGPCADLSRELQKRHVEGIDIKIVAISRGEIEANRLKAQELELSFPILLQQKWEISREYGIFVTPVAYLIDGHGVTCRDVAIGREAILSLITENRPKVIRTIETRLTELQTEFDKGQDELRMVDQRRQYLLEALQRITGARHVLLELLQAKELK